MDALVVEGLTKRFGKVLAVSDLSFSVPPGAIVGLVGPNGSGKTTLLSCCVGILKPEKGRVLVNGIDMTSGDPEAKRHVAFSPEHPDTVPTMTAWDHLTFVARMLQLQNWEPEGERLLQIFDLAPKRNKLTSGYSKGEHQKLMLAMAILRRPSVLLLDEPLLGLDPRASVALKREVRSLVALGSSAILCSHVLTLVEELCPVLGVMSRGRLTYWGTPEGLRVAASAAPGTPLEDSFVRLTEPGTEESDG
jgi:ABC-2 type transport system ATP-binding protein